MEWKSELLELYKGSEWHKEERERYGPPVETGRLQKWVEGKIEEIREKDVERAFEISSLREEFEDLKIRIRKLEEQREVSEEIIEVRDIPMEQIKKEMLSLLSDGKTIYADEIAAELKLDIRDVIEAFRELQKEGKLFIDESKL